MARKRDKTLTPPATGPQPPQAAKTPSPETQCWDNSAEQYRNIFEAGPLGMAVVGLDDRLSDVNGAFCRLLGFSKQELIGLRLEEITHPDDRARDEDLARQLRQGLIPSYQVEKRYLRRDQRMVWGRLTASMIRAPSGEARHGLCMIEEITERKKAEEKLIESELRLRRLAENVREVFWIVSLDWNEVIYISPAYEDIWGRSCASLYQNPRSWFDAVDPEDRDPVAADVAKRSAGDFSPAEGPEYRVIRPDGSVRWIQARSFPVRNERGEIICVAGICEDITAHKQASEALRAVNEQLQAVIQASPLAIFVLDPKGIVQLWNPAAERIFGWTAQEAVGQFLPIVPQESIEAHHALRAQVLRGEAFSGIELRRRRKDGSPVDISISTAPLRDARGEITGIMAVNQDITERKRIEAALRESEARLRTALDSVPFDFWIRDQDGRCILENAATLERWGSLIGTRPEDTNLPEETLAIWRENNRRVYAGEVVQGEVEYFDQGARQVYYNIVAPIRVEGEIIGILGINLDITERKKAEEALRDADRRKDEFLAMLAHELRNPLAPIRNAVQVMRVIGTRDAALKRQEDIIDRQVSHMARLLHDLLDVARITSGKIELNRQPLPLVDVIAHAVETATPLIDSRRHTFRVTPPPASLRIEGDIDRMAQVVGNLLTNAAKYTDDGGQIWLEAGREGAEAVVRVRDNGVGIDPAMLPRVFDLFTQANHSLARSQGGLGIGLKMVSNLVQMHGGSVIARSEGLGKGSEFIVRLPALADEEQAAGRPAMPEQQDAPVSSRRILVVDDLVDSSESLAELLTLWGYEVRTSYDGPAALEAARTFRPEIVILDIGMPGMDGYEVARRLRQADCPAFLLALTGYGQESDRKMAFTAGFDQFLVKPVDLSVLRKQLLRT